MNRMIFLKTYNDHFIYENESTKDFDIDIYNEIRRIIKQHQYHNNTYKEVKKLLMDKRRNKYNI